MSVLLPLTLWSVLTSSLVLCSTGHTGYGSDPGRQDWEESLFNGDGEEMGGGALLREWRGEEPRNGYGDETGPVPSDPHSLLEDEPSLKAVKREGHSLSIVNPLDVLRQRLMLEMARRRMKVNQEQIRENELLLKHLGKRAAPKDRTAGFRRHQVSELEDFEV